MDDDLDVRRRKRLIFIASGLIDIFIGGMLVLLGIGLLPADLLGFRMPPLGALFGALLLITGIAVTMFNLTRLGE